MATYGIYCNLLGHYKLSREKKTNTSMAPITQWQIISPETILEIITRAINFPEDHGWNRILYLACCGKFHLHGWKHAVRQTQSKYYIITMTYGITKLWTGSTQ